jgi:putative transposase
VTFCTKNRIDYFGEVIEGKVILNDYGKIVQESFFKTQKIRSEITFDECIIMPNHIHGIIIIQKPVGNAGMRSDTWDVSDRQDGFNK